MGMPFTEEEIETAWNKGTVAPGNDADKFRKDACKAWMGRSQYGNRDSQFGWEIDHIDGNSEKNVLSNLQPIQWENNLAKSDGPLKCVKEAQGRNNVSI